MTVNARRHVTGALTVKQHCVLESVSDGTTHWFIIN